VQAKASSVTPEFPVTMWTD